MKSNYKNIALALLAGCLFACSGYSNKSPFPTISEKARIDLDRPVDCNTANQNIKTLEEERASVAKQILSGVRSLMPIAAVAGILMGDYTDRVHVATGIYNADIEAKVKQIKSTCGIM